MDIICSIVLMILAADLTGTIFALVWFGMFRYFDKYLRADFINFSLKFVIISFYIPSMVILLWLKTHLFSGLENYYAIYTNLMRVLSVLVLVIFVVKLVKEIKKWRHETDDVLGNIIFESDASADTMAIVNEVRKELKIRRKFKVYVAVGIGSPFIYGFFRPKIYITADRYESEDLKMILTHELYHYKQLDPYMKPLAGIMCCMHWFNPLPKKIRERYETFAEAGSDYKCIKKAGYNEEDYFDCLIRTSNNLYDSLVRIISTSGSKGKIYERAFLASKYTLRKVKMGAFISVVVLSAMTSSIAVYAATDITESIYNYLFIKSSRQFEENAVICDDGFIEYNESINNIDEMKKADSYMEVDCSDEKIIHKLVSGETTEPMVGYLMFNLINIGECNRIVISINADKSDLDNNEIKLELGIIEPDGVKRYIEGSSIINHTFEISKSGNYKIYIINKSEKSITVGASFEYFPREED
ncbi:MAG: M56 family metallopeptidase [Lachnospiraceae bacterium]|nr:M56 family metallopeptidase [Lachnospiraceae bacterium]